MIPFGIVESYEFITINTSIENSFDQNGKNELLNDRNLRIRKRSKYEKILGNKRFLVRFRLLLIKNHYTYIMSKESDVLGHYIPHSVLFYI